MIQQMLVIWPLVQPWTLVISRLLKAFPIFSFIFVPWFISLVFPHIIYYRSILFIFVSLICGCKTVKCFKIFALFLKFNTALIKLFSLFLQVFKNSGLYFCFSYLCVCVCVCVFTHTHTHIHPQVHPTLCGPMDCSPQSSSAHRIFQARILQWGTISSSRGSSPPMGQTPLCFLHWQADSLHQYHLGSPHFTSIFFMKSAWRKI